MEKKIIIILLLVCLCKCGWVLLWIMFQDPHRWKTWPVNWGFLSPCWTKASLRIAAESWAVHLVQTVLQSQERQFSLLSTLIAGTLLFQSSGKIKFTVEHLLILYENQTLCLGGNILFKHCFRLSPFLFSLFKFLKFLKSVIRCLTVFPASNTALWYDPLPPRGSPDLPCRPQYSDVHQLFLDLQFGWRLRGASRAECQLCHRYQLWAEGRRWYSFVRA